MARTVAKTRRKNERGMALLLTLFALLLLSAIGLFMVLSSNTETRIDANYGSSLRAYYAARSGIEEVRERIKYPSGSPGGLADKLPTDVAGNSSGVLYIVNPAAGEAVDPVNPANVFFDDQLCHDYNSDIPAGIKCTTVPSADKWQSSLPAMAPGQLGYKWVRINIKTNRTVAPNYCVDQQPCALTSPLMDMPVCWDGQAEQISPGGNCDANGMQTVYMLTALATSGATGPNGARKQLKFEVVAPSIRPAGAVTASSLVVPSGMGIPAFAVDGRAHYLNGSPIVKSSSSVTASNGCSSVAALATDSGSDQMEQALNQIRKTIVEKANASCNADGTPASTCTSGLWWVRGMDASPRFVTSGSSSSSTIGSSSSGSTSGGSDRDGGRHGGQDDDPPVGVSSGLCDGTASCYTNLDLAAPQLYGLPAGSIAPFTGGFGNQTDGTIYQPGAKQTITNQIAAVQNLVSASVGQSNYFKVSAAGLASSYGEDTPAIVEITDSINLQNPLTGYGILVVDDSLQINSTLQWTGLVVVTSKTGQMTIGSGASGQIIGALLLQPGAKLNFPAGSAQVPSFHISYSCEAIDLPFKKRPFKVISTAETSF